MVKTKEISRSPFFIYKCEICKASFVSKEAAEKCEKLCRAGRFPISGG